MDTEALLLEAGTLYNLKVMQTGVSGNTFSFAQGDKITISNEGEMQSVIFTGEFQTAPTSIVNLAGHSIRADDRPYELIVGERGMYIWCAQGTARAVLSKAS